MCNLAPRAAAPGIGATAFLDRRRGIVAAATSRHNAGEPATRRTRASEASAAPAARKRSRHVDGFEHVGVVDPAAASSSALRSRMDKELVALQGLLKRAKLLPRRSTPPAEKKCVPAPRRSQPPPPVVPSSAAKRTTTTTSQSRPKAATEAPAPACQTRITASAANPKQQQRPKQRAAAKNPIAPEVPNMQRPAEAPSAAKPQQEQRPVVQRAAAAAKTAEVPKKRRPQEEKELARAAAREAFRQMLLEMEKSALKDEKVYPEEMEELGIPFEFLVTRTWKQAMLDYHAKKVECS